ncbi:helix-turn-helix transcriptional regulator [Methanospirillum sp. J.3.6.1-F.2.7.3]|jgi:putative transcriptional regulator|uniref:Helix-turn-helix transcriptional regulator n=2 Tax=Methanospirillum TaxID=2202 RepID=A0A8E7EIQ0_9EURY|nr:MULTISPECIES: helix-turn-helix transcriptional regulator [Methanospirillum]MDX8550255.1 helix-turn-helix transcriptional regulator [Methanospirillum hungatei]NLW75914.1 helix-turn-helix transcriptional regulator [Methanomicrobiales archaeon]QVV90357.1 helix-turn-helix transcriptional regulator [Methanospirillum sp. J.3.6.1-F.2.7.3]QXO94742.1 helix-turn-helix transcriptional regulator [Methanospirillum hungatei]
MKNNIRIYRAIHNLTQEELARKISVTRKTVNSIEGGKYNPSIDVAYKMAKLFHVTIEELFCFEDEENNNEEEDVYLS